MDFEHNDIVKPSGRGKTENWPPYIQGKVLRVDKKFDSIFVIWNGTHFEDEMKPDELVKVQQQARSTKFDNTMYQYYNATQNDGPIATFTPVE